VSYLILALADDGLIFDRAHAKCMSLPFDHGWESWHVYHRNGRNLSFIDSFSTFDKARRFTETHPILHVTVGLSNVLH
jgi:hypothetical protein